MAKCKDCIHFPICEPHTDPNESYPEVGGCPAFKGKDAFVEVVHGHWNIIADDYDCEMMQCSVCKSEFYDGDNDTVDCLHNYCPHCGAKMNRKDDT